MATSKLHAKALARLFHATSQPIYVLDNELSIIFLNQACKNLLGIIADQLLGKKCAYHTPCELNTADDIAAALCPPPEATTGLETSAVISFNDASGKLQQCRVLFRPICAPNGDLITIIAIIDTLNVSGSAFILEPASDTELQSGELHEAIRRFRYEAAGRYHDHRLVGNSPAMQLARRQVELASKSSSSVLLIGPAGSGKQHIASAIYYANHSDMTAIYPSGGLIPLDCSVLSGDLILSTVAAFAKSNIAEEKSKQATLLLNHVDEISTDLQTSLSFIFTKKTFSPRLISTARVSLADLADRGLFRPDLAAFLSTITIVLPPLSQRLEDLPILSQIFLEEINSRQSKQLGGFTHEAIDRLHVYSWPGNLDELMTVVAQASKNALGHEISTDDLPERLHLAKQADTFPKKTEEKIVLDEYLGRVERELIRRALAKSKGNKAKAARLLGLTRPRLYRRMIQLGLEDKTNGDAPDPAS